MNKTITTTQIDRSRQLQAAVLILLGAVFFSAKAILIKLAYRHGIDSTSLLMLRMSFSLPLFLLVAWWSARKKGDIGETKISRKDWFSIVLLGVVGYYLASWFDFLGLQYVTASMERLILFVYPTLVLVISVIFLKKRIRKQQYLALALTYLGIALAFAEGLYLDASRDFILGCLFIFCSSLTFAVYMVGSGHLLPRIGTLRYTSYAMTAASVAVIIHHGLVYQWALFHYPAAVYILALLMAAFCTVIPAFMVSEGIRIIGSGNASIIGSIGPISTILLAYIFLGETLGHWQWLGTFLVIGGVLIISLGKNRERS